MTIFTCLKRHDFILLSFNPHAAKCHAISSPRYVIMYPVTKYNARAMLSNIDILWLAYIKLSVDNLNSCDNNDKES